MESENKITTTEDTSEMLSLSEFKKALGKSSSNYSDEQIKELRIKFDRIANVAFEKWIQERNSGII